MGFLVKMTLGFRAFCALTLTMRLNRLFHSLGLAKARPLTKCYA